jgi:hypothetical protein
MNHIQSDKYTPWHIDYWFGIGWLISGMIGSWSLVLYDHKLIAAVIAIWFMSNGWGRVMKGLARERGVEVERRAFKSFLHKMELGEYFIQSDIPMTSGGICYGNVDMVVSPIWTQASYVIEIKAYSGIVLRWYGLCRDRKFYRLWSPQKQVRRQCRYLGKQWNFPVLWLPESKLNTWIIHNGILIINGDADLLMYGLRLLDDRVRLPVCVTFPRAPGDGYTGFLKGKGFTYNGTNYRWYGSESKQDVNVLASVLGDVSGQVEWVRRIGIGQ